MNEAISPRSRLLDFYRAIYPYGELTFPLEKTLHRIVQRGDRAGWYVLNPSDRDSLELILRFTRNGDFLEINKHESRYGALVHMNYSALRRIPWATIIELSRHGWVQVSIY